MSERIRYTVINNRKILLVDLSHLSGKDLLDKVMYTCVEFQKIDKKTLFLFDVTGTTVNLEAFNYLYGAAKDIQKHVDKSALIGKKKGIIDNFFKLYIKLTSSSLRSFETKNEAIEYLTK